MRVLILGGNSPHHHDWVRSLGRFLADRGHDPVLQDYRHWQTGDADADLDHEIAVAGRLMRDKGQDAPTAIVAKSVGCMIAALGAARGVLAPERCLLLGMPLDGIAGQTPDLPAAMRTLPATTLVQHEHDPYGSAATVRAWLATVDAPRVRLVVTPGDTHAYTDLHRIERELVAVR